MWRLVPLRGFLNSLSIKFGPSKAHAGVSESAVMFVFLFFV